MSDNESLDCINNLGESTLVAGGDYTFNFICVNDVGVAINLTGAQCSLKLSPYGNPTVVSLTKTGTITSTVNGTWKVVFLPADTATLYGVYQFQAQVIDNGVPQATFIPGQGILNIIAKIA